MHHRHPSRFLVFIIGLVLASTLTQSLAVAQVAPFLPGSPSIEFTLMDRSVDPADDFYRYANGRWLDTAELPEGEYRYGPFNENTNEVDEILFDVLLDFEPDQSTDAGKARSFYDQIVDEERRADLGVTPIQPVLDEIMAITSIEEGLEFQMGAYNYRLQGLFYPATAPNVENSEILAGYIADSDLSLPSFWDYLDHSDEGDELKEEWVTATATLLEELGYSPREAHTAAEAVLEFETDMARAMWRIPEDDGTHPWNVHRTLDELQDLSPAIDWETYVAESALPDDLDVLYLQDLLYLEALDGILADADPLVLQYLFATQLAWLSANYLTMDMFEVAQDFESRVVNGIDAEPDLEVFAYQATTQNFPDVFARAYVEEAFSPATKAEVEDLVQHMIDAFRLRIENNEWMSDETKAKAIEKLELMTVLVGYPDEWTSYENVIIGDSVYETMQNIYTLTNARTLGEVGGPIDRSEWPMSAFEINAAYIPTQNAIVFPAGVLQSPFFDPNADLAFNYGGIGAVIGHEITHAFDISGSQYDGYGNLVEWWTPEDYDAFSALNAQVIAQYDELEVLPDLFVDGELTITEN
ncbi:MAG TPA: M13 family metallopeptidase, partial [Thermomicrobiales bacterium]|nr:M13 family metallopeptidase [Thermomicrobiales bacterium]